MGGSNLSDGLEHDSQFAQLVVSSLEGFEISKRLAEQLGAFVWIAEDCLKRTVDGVLGLRFAQAHDNRD